MERHGAAAGSGRRVRGVVVAMGVLGALLLGSAPARAGGEQAPGGSVSSRQVARWAAAAAQGGPEGDAALERLRRVRVVDGRPARLDRALAGTSRRTAQERAATLAESLDATRAAPGSSSAVDRAAARRVLDDPDYRPAKVPRPLEGVLRWIGDRLATVFGPIGDALTALFGTTGAAVVVVLALGGAAVLAAVVVARRRTRAAADAADAERRGRLVDPGADPVALEAAAADAERAGHWARAVRLRYEAGLLRLHRAGRLDLRAQTTTAAAARAVHDPRFDDLTATFERVVYGDEPATAADADAARHGWAAVLDPVRAR